MSSENVRSIGKPDKKKLQIRAQIFHNLVDIFELFPQYSIVHHLATITRRKDDKAKEFYHWTEEELLSRIEKHKTELEGDDMMNNEEEGD
jgi:hypothetical protein